MYGNEKYGTSNYAAEYNPGSEDTYYTDLFQIVPEFISQKSEMHALYDAQGYEVGYMEHSLEDTINQCFVVSATWGLEHWEKMLGIETNLQLSFEQRREVIIAKICGQGTTTMEMIKNTAAVFSGGDVDVLEDNAHSRFIVRFVGTKGIPRNIRGFIEMLEEIKPAHLAYEFEYRYTVWNWLKQNYTWNSLQKISWDELRVLKED